MTHDATLETIREFSYLATFPVFVASLVNSVMIRFRACRPLEINDAIRAKSTKFRQVSLLLIFVPAISSITVNRGIVIVKAGLISTMKSI